MTHRFRSGKTGNYSKIVLLYLLAFILPCISFAYQNKGDSLPQNATINDCIRYSLAHNPAIQNAQLNEDITETIIKSKLAEWYPQISFTYNLQHNFELPHVFFNGNLIPSGTKNTSSGQFGLTQNIFSRDVLLAARSAHDVRLSVNQNIQNQRINLTVAVSKIFYDIILTMQQLQVNEEDINRNIKTEQNAYYQYQSGIVDKTDYKRATIALNNSRALKTFTEESLKAKNAFLKELMGYARPENIHLAYDTSKMEQDIYIDTSQTIHYSNRIEVQRLETQKKLQQYNLQYYKWSFLPDVYAFGNYNLDFLNNQFSKLYSQNFPNSFAGITLAIPIFKGGKRQEQIKGARFQIMQVDNDIQSLKDSINTQYQSALASYKGNLNNYFILKENVSLASEVYDILLLQYRSGVKAFLDVITAETDLRTAQINYYNALYQVISSKIDVAQALGNVQY